MKRHLPNTITCFNIISGSLAIVSIINNNLVEACYFVGIATFLDFIDGLAARIFNASTELGSQLDSLADMISFGVAPGLIMHALMVESLINESIAISNFVISGETIALISFLIIICSALRLAKFNIDPNQASGFIGLPTPANAILISSFPLIIRKSDLFDQYLLNPLILAGLSLILSYLLISNIPLFSLKLKSLSWGIYKVQFIFLLLSLILLIKLFYLAIPLIILLYVVLSLINNLLSK